MIVSEIDPRYQRSSDLFKSKDNNETADNPWCFAAGKAGRQSRKLGCSLRVWVETGI